MLIPFKEALDKYRNTASFCKASNARQKEALKPYQMTDRIQEELLNLDVVEIVDTGKAALKVSRRNNAIQKDFFSAFSYAVYGVHEYIEMPYYKKHAKGRVTKIQALSQVQSAMTSRETAQNKYRRF